MYRDEKVNDELTNKSTNQIFDHRNSFQNIHFCQLDDRNNFSFSSVAFHFQQIRIWRCPLHILFWIQVHLSVSITWFHNEIGVLIFFREKFCISITLLLDVIFWVSCQVLLSLLEASSNPVLYLDLWDFWWSCVKSVIFWDFWSWTKIFGRLPAKDGLESNHLVYLKPCNVW